ncbi:hypothetical protein FACS1894216_21580 [Synergistales bacterium]|nr:hypothetical protein FACS1894216_21580 [Synergistales bacterium]
MLPADFWKIKKFFTPDCRVNGDRFYAKEGGHRIDYYRVPLSVHAPEDVLDMPETIKCEFTEICAAALGGEDTRPLLDRLCNSNIARGIDGYRDTGPAQVWGGKG